MALRKVVDDLLAGLALLAIAAVVMWALLTLTSMIGCVPGAVVVQVGSGDMGSNGSMVTVHAPVTLPPVTLNIGGPNMDTNAITNGIQVVGHGLSNIDPQSNDLLAVIISAVSIILYNVVYRLLKKYVPGLATVIGGAPHDDPKAKK
jgi:hypothetical protein